MRRVRDVLSYVLRGTVGWVLLRLFRTTFIGVDNVPRKPQGAVLAGNHSSYGDPVLLWCGSPRRTRFMAKAELWETGWLGSALNLFWAFPVNRGAADRHAIQTATTFLEHGELVGIFPEGTRNRSDADELGAAHGGVAFIAMRANAPVVPVGIANTDMIRPKGSRRMHFPHVVIVYGEPVCPEDIDASGRKERVEKMTAEIMRRIAEARGRAREVAG